MVYILRISRARQASFAFFIGSLLFYVYFAFLLNNHHQDGKGQGAIERVQDVTAIRRLSTVTAGDGFLLKPFRRR